MPAAKLPCGMVRSPSFAAGSRLRQPRAAAIAADGGKNRVGGWHGDPCLGSLGLLPSGPDPVGEWLVHHQPPKVHIGNSRSECKGDVTLAHDSLAGRSTHL